MLVGRDLHRSFGPTQALRGASATVAEREIVAIMGPSGSGKSTLLHCLAGILTPDFGEVHFAGRRIDQLSDSERVELRRTAFGFMFQFGQLVPELPAMENIALSLLLAGHRRKAALNRAREWLPRLGIDGLGERLPGELSGGEGQRVALARALISKPAVAVLASLVSLRRVRISPLGTSRRGRRPPPSAWHALPLGIGIGGQLALLALRDRLGDLAAQLAGLFGVVTVVGLATRHDAVRYE
jgi:ABC-type lipoprotein export system ATPase subunit